MRRRESVDDLSLRCDRPLALSAGGAHMRIVTDKRSPTDRRRLLPLMRTGQGGSRRLLVCSAIAPAELLASVGATAGHAGQRRHDPAAAEAGCRASLLRCIPHDTLADLGETNPNMRRPLPSAEIVPAKPRSPRSRTSTGLPLLHLMCWRIHATKYRRGAMVRLNSERQPGRTVIDDGLCKV